MLATGPQGIRLMIASFQRLLWCTMLLSDSMSAHGTAGPDALEHVGRDGRVVHIGSHPAARQPRQREAESPPAAVDEGLRTGKKASNQLPSGRFDKSVASSAYNSYTRST